MQERSIFAFVLHTRPYREKQALISLLTQDEGKVSAISYVGHSAKSSRKALLQPFLPVKVTLKGQQDLKQLVRIEAVAKSIALEKNALFSAFYINELLVKLLAENIPCQQLYYTYQDSLHALSIEQSNGIEIILRKFELTLLDELGIAVDFSLIFENPAKAFYYITEQGFIPKIEKLNAPSYRREHLQAIAEHNYTSVETLKTFKQLMRQIISQLLGGIPLNSRKLFASKTYTLNDRR